MEDTLQTIKDLPVLVYDNGGETFDRYTIVDMNTGEVYSMSENATSPDGINQYAGTIGQELDHPQDHAGKKIEIDELPLEVMHAIIERLNN